MSRRICMACLSFVLVCVAFTFVSAEALVRSYVEDFTTKEYCDTLTTSAWWDTVAGEVKLHPFELTLAGSYDTPGPAYGVTISGDYAYVAEGGSVLGDIDIRDPTNPAPAGIWDVPDNARDVAISGDHAYVTDGGTGVWVVDISDPASRGLQACSATRARTMPGL